VQAAPAPDPQTVFGALHAQVEAVHVAPGMQTIPQPPQLEALNAVSTQVPVAGSLGQSPTVVGVVLHKQAPAAQVPRPQE
jgi:hypothetical protein